MTQDNIRVGQVVISLAGRDAGFPAVVLGQENGYILVSDGKERPLSRPKQKNPKHITATEYVLSSEQTKTDKSLRKALSECIVKEDL